ncbi:hypothetical protein LCGC14_2400500, partial [marine sediment metagenome]
ADDQHVLDAEVIAAAIDKTIQTTKGDILSATGASTPVRVGVGANDTVLTADSAQASGVKWATAGGGVDTSGTPVATDYARFTDADTIEGRDKAQMLGDINVADGADVTGSNPPQAHGASVHTNITREFFLPANEGYIVAGTRSTDERGSVVTGGANANEPIVHFQMVVPVDFVSFGSVKAVWQSTVASGNMYWRLRANYEAAGEATNTHTETPALGVAATAGAILLNVQEPANPLTLASLALGDFLGLEFNRPGANASDTLGSVVRLYGLLFSYTANQ